MAAGSRGENYLNDLFLRIKKYAPLPLPGNSAQFKMAPEGRHERAFTLNYNSSPRDSAVMVFLECDANGACFIYFILRKKYAGVHSGQIGFPGGKLEPGDPGLVYAAMREAEEEIGIKAYCYTIIQNLSPLYVPASNFIIHPFLALIERPFQPSIHHREVEELIKAPVNIFFEPECIKQTQMTFSNGYQAKVPYYDLNGKVLWGATAMITSELVEMIRNLRND